MKWKERGMVYMQNNETKQYAKYLLKSNKRLCFILGISLFVIIPFLIMLTNNSSTFGIKVWIIATVFFGCALSCLTPIFLFRYIYLKRSSDLYFSLPIKRNKLFTITFLTGFITIVIPVIINSIIIFILSHSFIQTTPQIDFASYILTTCIMMLALYGIVTWVTLQCNNLLDGVLASGSYLFVPIIFISALTVFMNNQFGNFMVASGTYIEEIPFHNIIPSIISIPYSVINGTLRIFQYNITPYTWFVQIYWLLIGILFSFLAKRSFVRRKQEDSEQRTSVWWIYPLIIGTLTFSLILIVVNVGMSIISIVISSISVFILYLCMVFFSRRKIQLTLRVVLLFVVLFASSYSFSLVFQKTQGFQIVKEIPSNKISDITSAELQYIPNHNYNEQGKEIPTKIKYKVKDKEKTLDIFDFNAYGTSQKDIQTMFNIQKSLINDKNDENTNSITIVYLLKDGTSIIRWYQIDDALAIKQIKSILSDNANKQNKFNITYKQYPDYS